MKVLCGQNRASDENEVGTIRLGLCSPPKRQSQAQLPTSALEPMMALF